MKAVWLDSTAVSLRKRVIPTVYQPTFEEEDK